VYLFWVFLPVIAASLAWNRAEPFAFIAGSLAAGLLLWTPIEYATHRYVLHRLAPHYQHHDEPAVLEYLFAPLWLSGGFALALWAILAAPIGWRHAALVESGTIAGYLFYEAVHVRIHSQAAGGLLLRYWRKQHYYHHFADDTRCYGVTTPLWDHIFRTASARALPHNSEYHDRNSDGTADLDVRATGEGQGRR